MGKQTDNLNALREQKALKERLYADTMGRCGGQMNYAYKNYNAQNHVISMRLLEREIQQAERLADAEREMCIRDRFPSICPAIVRQWMAARLFLMTTEPKSMTG